MSSRGSIASFLASRPGRPNPPPREPLQLLVSRAVAGAGAPPRPNLRRAIEAVAGPWPGALPPGRAVVFEGGSVRVGDVARPLAIADPAEAWEAVALRGLIPRAWVDDPDRHFVVAAAQRRAHAEHDFAWVGAERQAGAWCVRRFDGTRLAGPEHFAEPPAPLDLVLFVGHVRRPPVQYAPGFRRSPCLLEQAVALASDAANVAGAEALVGEIVRRLGPWLFREAAARPVRLGWGASLRGDLPPAWAPPQPQYGAIGALVESCGAAQFGRSQRRYAEAHAEALRLTGPGPSALLTVAHAAFMWRDLAARGGRVVAGGGYAVVPPETVGTPFADLECPLDPLLDLWARGYGLHDTEGPNMRLEAPPLRVPVDEAVS